MSESAKGQRVRLQIRKSTYRGVAGFTVSGTTGHVFPARVFVETREDAEKVKANLKADRQAFYGFPFYDPKYFIENGEV